MDVTVNPQGNENFGRVAAEEAGVWRDVVKGVRRETYNAPALESAALPTPDAKSVQRVLDTFYPSGALPGDGNASTLFAFRQRLEQPGQIPFKEFDAFRKLAGNKARDLADTDRTASAAWSAIKSQLDEVEQAAIASAQHKLQVTGQGPWGPVYGNLAGDPENAIAHLLRTKTGEVPGAGIHPLAGPIDLIAGNSKMGLRHIEAKGRDEVLRGLPGLLSEGSWYSRPSSGPGRTYLGGPKHEAVVRMEWDGGAKQWMPNAYERGPKNSYPLETGRTTNWADFNSGQLSPGKQAGMRASIDDAWGQVLSDAAVSRQPAVPAVSPRDPRQYVGLLAPEAASALRQGRNAHIDLVNRFESGPAMYLWRTGPDGLPMAQGAEVARRFLNSGASQVADAQALKRMVLERGPTLQAAREHVMADLLQRSTNPAGGLLEAKLRNHVNARSGLLGEIMTAQQRDTIGRVQQDLRRANAAETQNKVGGPDTAQKLQVPGQPDRQAFLDAHVVKRLYSCRFQAVFSYDVHPRIPSPAPNMSIPALSDWLRTPQGRHLLEWEQAGFDRLVADVFGYNALQVGLPECDFLRMNRMPLRLRVARAGAAEVHATEYDLPFASASLDLVLLPHVLEFSPQPHQVLREVERVLVPEGSVIIAGFNPYSLWGLRRLAARTDPDSPWDGQYRSVPRIRDWLTLLGFETRAADFGCHAPPVRSQRWIERWRCLEQVGARWWPVCGGSYLLQGIKRVQGMRLITPRWRDRKRAAKRFSPVVQRDGRIGQDEV